MEGKTKAGNQKATTVWNGIRRWNRQILCVGAGLALYGAAMAGAEGGPEQEGILERREWGDGETEYQLYVQGLEEGWLPLEVEIQPRRYGEEEAEQIFETILEELPEQMRGANPSLEQVREDLELPDSFPEYGVEARWESLDPELISSFGEIRGRPEQKERARLSVELTDGVHERRETLWVQVCPLSETETERLLEALREQIRQADLQNPEEGTVRLPEGCRWAAVFQEDRLLSHLDAWGNLRFAGCGDGPRAAGLLAELGLLEEAEKPVREFSGGMRRRLALIRALLAPSDALALDEPFTGLDEENRARCRAALLREAAGKPVLLVTHDADDVSGLEARLLRL